MAHRITAPAMQRAQRLLNDRVSPHILGNGLNFEVAATAEFFESPSYEVAVASQLEHFTLGTKWGRAWHTRWFRLTATVPHHLEGQQLVAHIDLGFIGRGDGFEVEALAYRNGRILHAIQPDRRIIHLGTGTAGEHIELWIEAAATPIIAGHQSGYGPTPFGDPATAPTTPIYTLRTARLCVFHAEINEFSVALHTCINLCIDLEERSPQRARLFAALERCDQAFDSNNLTESLPKARAELDAVLSVGNGPSAHRIVATGHAHLDTAWLWPIRETRRKAVRTFANAVSLLKNNPDAVFCHSQAQHYAWVAEDAPELFAEVKRLVAEGRWEPVGGMWVETDLNLPSGESLLRQLVQGQRAFSQWFNITCNGAFLPDDFGYPGGLPQIVAHGGCEWFFTQKLSWNETNRMPHHSFWWEGIDGTQVFTHFSPVDTYNALLTTSQLRFAERNFRDHVGASSSLVLYGHGDGGGGPTQTMIDRGRLANDLEGVPRVSFGTVKDFFADTMDEYGASAPRWVGEMYFEKHRGTYSTQVKTKQGNRWSERLLHELELWSAAAGVRPSSIDNLWQRVLTQQFHDIIPGSSIAWVYDDAEAEHAAVAEEVEVILARVIPVSTGSTHVLNPAPVAVTSVVDVDGSPVWVDTPAFSSAPTVSELPDHIQSVSVEALNDGWRIANGIISFDISRTGHIESISNGARNLLPPGLVPSFTLRQDRPAEYDAWDIDATDANAPLDAWLNEGLTAVVESGPLRAIVECSYATDASQFTVRYTLRANAPTIEIALDANWHETERRLQWQLPTGLRSVNALCGTQFGHVERARHTNTSWDVARFEVCAHRYVAVHERSFGVAILADGPHGYDVRGDELKVTLLRAPRFPDPQADIGQQHLEWSVMLTDGDPLIHGLEEEASRIAHPLRIIDGTPSVSSLGIDLRVPGSLVSAVKPADDDSGDLIVRIWETLGAHTSGTLQLLGATDAELCNGLEEPNSVPLDVTDQVMEIDMRPFEIQTIRIRR
jgi:alpha-mannosidase